MALLACTVAPQLIHVSDTLLETLSWCFNLEMAPRTNVVQEQSVTVVLLLSVFKIPLKKKLMCLNVTKHLIQQSSCYLLVITSLSPF